MPSSVQTTERLALGWVRVTPADGSPYYAQPRTQKTQYDEPLELRQLRQLSLDLIDTAETGTPEDIGNLLSQGADVNAQDPAGVTPAMKAAMFNNTDALARLLEEGPDLTVRDCEYGRTALLWAAYRGHCVGDPPGGSVGILIRAGANPDDVDSAGKRAMDLCCLALDVHPEVRVERLPILEHLLQLLQLWREIRSSEDAITKLVHQGKFGAAAQKVEDTLVTIADVLAGDILSKTERPEFDAMHHTLQGWRGWCEFGARRRGVERQLEKVKLQPTETLDEVNDALNQADATLLAYEDLVEECHSWPTNSDEAWRDVEAAGVAAGLEESEKLRTSLHEEHLRLEKEHSAELERLAADMEKEHSTNLKRLAAGKAQAEEEAERLRRKDQQRRSDQALKEARLRRLAREKEIAAEKRRVEAEETAQERVERERKQREEEAAFQGLQEILQGPRISSISARRVEVKKQQRLKDQHRRIAKAKAAVRLVGEMALKQIEHDRDKIIYHAALGSEDIAATHRLREELIWQSSSEEWQRAVASAVAATERYKSALAVLLQNPSALSENATIELMKAAEEAHELADVLEEEAQSAEDKRLAYNTVMNATGDLRAHVVQEIGSSSSTMLFGTGKDTKQQQPLDLVKVAQVLQQSEGRAPQPLKSKCGFAGNMPGSPRLGAKLSARVKQHQADNASTAQTEAILRAQKGARRRIVEEAHRKAAVSQLVRTAETGSADGGQLPQPHSASDSSVFDKSMTSNASIPDWIDEADGTPNAATITFTSPRQIKLQTESEYRKQQQKKQQQQTAVAANTHKDEMRNKRVTQRTQLPVRMGIQDTCSTRSFPAMLPPDMPAALYLTMQQHEADRAAKEYERRARAQGWRANMQVDPTPPEKRVYKYGDVDIRVGGRGSRIVETVVSEIRNHKREQELIRGANMEISTQPGTGRERLAVDAMLTPGRTANRSSRNLVANAGWRGDAATIEQRCLPTDSDLDRYWSSVMVRKHDLGRDLPSHQEIRAKMQTPPRSNRARAKVPETDASSRGYDAIALRTTPRPRRMNLDQVQPRVDSWSFLSKKPQLNLQVQPLMR